MFDPESGKSSYNRLALGTGSVPQHGLVYHRDRRLQGIIDSIGPIGPIGPILLILQQFSGMAARCFGDLGTG